jgi:PIN domain nuclease of toxin-antitoxin system
VRLLIDTHVLLWWRDDSLRLSDHVRREIANPNNEICVSVVTLWEIVLKRGSGKLQFPDDLEQVVREESFTLVPIDFRHLRTAEALPPLHGDPFDRMLIAQAIVEGAPLVTNDQAISRYGIATVW